MTNGAATPGLADLYQLGEQIELDKSASVRALRQRDHAIGLQCEADDDAGRLLFWLGRVADERGAGPNEEGWLTEAGAVLVARLTALVLGFIAMATFLLSSGQGLVNALIFLLLFVLVQVVFCLVSVLVMLRCVRGSAPVVMPVNPARLVISKVFPDRRYLRESQSVVRLLLLRYGQEFGAIFTLGAVAAFFIVLAFKDFTFVWGSTFSVGNDFVERFTSLLSTPWSAWLPAATLSPQVIADTRFHPAFTDLGQADIASLRGWWPFLIMAMCSYALLPRLLLWGLSGLFYTRLMRRSFARYPGAEPVLARMTRPVVKTQALEPEDVTPRAPGSAVAQDEGLVLLNWAGALAASDLHRFEEISAVPPANVVAGGLGSLADDELGAASINRQRPERLLVAVKAWEPPMADLRDFLGELQRVTHCTLCLVPLPGKSVVEHNLQEWRDFSRELPFAVTDTQALSRL